MALFTKTLEQIKKTAADIREVKQKNRDALTAAREKVESIKAGMAEALDAGNVQLYTAKAAELARANTEAKTAEDACAVTDTFPETKPAEVIAAWNAVRPGLDKDIQKAAAAYTKAFDTFVAAYVTYAKTLSSNRKTRDEYLSLVDPAAVKRAADSVNFNLEYLNLPAGFIDLVNPSDTGDFHQLDGYIRNHEEDAKLQAAQAVIESVCASSLDF